MFDRKWTILFPSHSMPPEYLSAVESFMCGTRYQLHFSSKPSCAMALTLEEAEKLLKIMKQDHLPPYHPKFDDEGNLKNPRNDLQIIEVPWLHADKEASYE